MAKFRFRIWAVALACGLSACLGVRGAISETAAVSTNTFGMLKIEAATTNTMIAVPWTWYSKDQKDAGNIPVKKLVKPENLEPGDMLYTPVDNDTYAAWVLETNVVVVAVTNGAEVVRTNAEWSSVQVVTVEKSNSGSNASLQSAAPQNKAEGFGRMQFAGMDQEVDDTYYQHSRRIMRGNGLWLHRQKPLDDQGNIRPFWLYGQSVTTEVTTVVSGTNGLNATVCSTMIGNPYAEDIVLNNLTFTGVESGDRIKIHVGNNVNHDLVYVSGKGWREYTTKVINGVKKSGYTYQTVIPAGTAFWYDRRGANSLTIKWPVPGAVK